MNLESVDRDHQEMRDMRMGTAAHACAGFHSGLHGVCRVGFGGNELGVVRRPAPNELETRVNR